jgi:Flp pilus assembly protein TadG
MRGGHEHGELRQKHFTPATTVGRQRGGSLVEQALVLMVFLIILFGIIDFGHALYTYHFVSNAAREATRWASVRGATTSLPGGQATDASVRALVKDVAGMGLDPAKITTAAAWVPPPGGSPACVSPWKSPGCVVQVTVTYEYDLLPFLPVSTSTITMNSRSQMVISQ